MRLPRPAHVLTGAEVAAALGVEPARGLGVEEAAARLASVGPNQLVERGGKGPWRILWDQFASTMMVMLIAAAAVSAGLGDREDAIAILSIVVVNVALGFSQEFRAEKAIAALKRMSVPSVRVRREGRLVEARADALVPGDVVGLEAGNVVPADGRVVESASLRTQEAALTGESEPVDKVTDALADETLGVGDRRNMAFTGTVVAFGRGQMIVTATAMETELGKIASLLQKAGYEPTPLQKRLDRLGRELAVVALAIVAVVFALGLARGEPIREMFLTAVSLAVAAVPEGLPAVVTIALALGAQRMLRRRALIRKLPAVETLGSVDVICTDKTGTLTENRMTVTVIDVAGQRVAVEAVGPESGDGASALPDHAAFDLLLAGAVLCNDAERSEGASGEGAPGAALGDPTEVALVMVAENHGFAKEALARALPRVFEVPFDSARKRMSTVHEIPPVAPAPAPAPARAIRALGGAGHVVFTKGSVDGLMDLASHALTAEGAVPLDEELRARILRANAELAAGGMRVLGVGYRAGAGAWSAAAGGEIERDLVFLGLVGMIDPPRAEVRDAVTVCKQAGIRPVMITGDHPLTALSIARSLGFSAERAVTGVELERASDAELEELAESAAVFARVSPEHKLRLVEALGRRGHAVAMTGDGVNDAPALKRADIGVAMGVSGTDVAKEASDMVLLDDNFATIVAAVEEGRVIYDNIRKFIRYLVSTNSAEIGVMLLAPLIGMPLPLLPLQILWINLVTDGLPALALGLEPAERFLMRRPPHDARESVFARGLGVHAAWVGTLMTATCLGVGYVSWRAGDEHWQTMIFTTLALSQMAHVLAIRSERDSLFQQGVFSNPWAVGAVALTIALQALVVFVSPLQRVFHTVALTPADLGWCVGLASVIFVGVEIEKAFQRRGARSTREAGG